MTKVNSTPGSEVLARIRPENQPSELRLADYSQGEEIKGKERKNYRNTLQLGAQIALRDKNQRLSLAYSLADDYNSSKSSYTDLSIKYKIGTSTIRRLLKEAESSNKKVNWRTKSYREQKNMELIERLSEEISSTEVVNYSALARKYHVSPRTIGRKVKSINNTRSEPKKSQSSTLTTSEQGALIYNPTDALPVTKEDNSFILAIDSIVLVPETQKPLILEQIVMATPKNLGELTAPVAEIATYGTSFSKASENYQKRESSAKIIGALGAAAVLATTFVLPAVGYIGYKFLNRNTQMQSTEITEVSNPRLVIDKKQDHKVPKEFNMDNGQKLVLIEQIDNQITKNPIIPQNEGSSKPGIKKVNIPSYNVPMNLNKISSFGSNYDELINRPTSEGK